MFLLNDCLIIIDTTQNIQSAGKHSGVFSVRKFSAYLDYSGVPWLFNMWIVETYLNLNRGMQQNRNKILCLRKMICKRISSTWLGKSLQKFNIQLIQHVAKFCKWTNFSYCIFLFIKMQTCFVLTILNFFVRLALRHAK